MHEIARPRAAVEVLFVDVDGAVLIVEPTDGARWAVPGGPVARGERPREAAARVLYGQLGLESAPDRLLAADWSPLVRQEHVVFLFDGGELTDDELDAIELRPGDVDSWAFIAPEELFVMLEPRLTRRVTAALDARAAGRTDYLENGTPA